MQTTWSIYIKNSGWVITVVDVHSKLKTIEEVMDYYQTKYPEDHYSVKDVSHYETVTRIE